MLLSVLSALARLDIDPWREAADLARMPKTAAAILRRVHVVAGVSQHLGIDPADSRIVFHHQNALAEIGFARQAVDRPALRLRSWY